VAGLADELDAVLLVATDLVAFDEVVASGLGHAYAGFEGLVALDEISVGAQVEHDCVVPVPIDDVVANDAVGVVIQPE
jgi:hypothetical protein